MSFSSHDFMDRITSQLIGLRLVPADAFRDEDSGTLAVSADICTTAIGQLANDRLALCASLVDLLASLDVCLEHHERWPGIAVARALVSESGEPVPAPPPAPAATGSTIHTLGVRTRFGDYVQAFSTAAKRDDAYRALLLEWWRDDIGDGAPDDLADLAAEYFESPHRQDDNDAECDTIIVDAPATGEG